MPFVVRPMEDGKHFRYIGEAVILGAMHGEYVLESEDSSASEKELRGFCEDKERDILIR